MKRFRIQLVIAAIVFVCGVSLCGLIYIIGNKPVVYVNPGVVMSAPSPVAAPAQPAMPRSTMLGRQAHHTYPVQPIPYHYPSSTMPSYHGRLYQTSSAQVHSIGGGGGGFSIATTSGSSSSRGVRTTAVSVAMPTTSFIALASQREVAEPQAQEAPQVAKMSSSSRRAPGPPNPTDPLDEEHQLVEHPLGDAIWPLALLALTYACAILIRKRRIQ